MKKALLLLTAILIFFINNNGVFATSGCCSGHYGVNCEKVQPNGKVVCEDGWTGSSCDYDSMKKCNGYSPDEDDYSDDEYNYSDDEYYYSDDESQENIEEDNTIYWVTGAGAVATIGYFLGKAKNK